EHRPLSGLEACQKVRCFLVPFLPPSGIPEQTATLEACKDGVWDVGRTDCPVISQPAVGVQCFGSPSSLGLNPRQPQPRLRAHSRTGHGGEADQYYFGLRQVVVVEFE